MEAFDIAVLDRPSWPDEVQVDCVMVSSREFAPTIVDSLQRIGCKKIAKITERAIKALGTSDLTAGAIDAVMASDDEQRLAKLNRCNNSYYKSAESIAEQLLAFITTNKAGVRF